ncbi:MAG: hypothetical protein KBA96_11280 [Rhodocyclaceae bacterium]|mgnify:FL=1|jgi:hypothetical protein|nr:hypothetical protein [Rhodocyclaceae bacterium]MBP7081686.1 hypothetical protein [Rhodocyclaceae bacterium]
MERTNAEHYWHGNISRIRIAMEKLQDAIARHKKVECFEHMQVIDSSLASLRSSIRENMDGPADQPMKRRETDR